MTECLLESIEDDSIFLKRNMLPPRALSCTRIIAQVYICFYCLPVAVAKHHNQVNLQKKGFNWAHGSRGFIYTGRMITCDRWLVQQLRAHILIPKQKQREHWEWFESFEALKPTPTMAHILILPKQFH